ncbi:MULTISPECIES: hypothetical protein [Prauserella salsuginis group]|uniref:Uncharacterized protein n=1 Tax=Prauserella salsuginis TaxID=387889 RepID=A0ABW6G3G1_9PSEU|nr:MULTISPECIES: hypothetical protein [Prauserella salsuginis group]MCR3718577.1 hypothetical protein [Prauserella flava]MCR3733147.1 hypothetical protein [Prauserella salsuginis]
MVTTLLFAAGLILVLAVIGRTVHYPGLPFDVEPAFARYVVTGLVILWHIGQANADRMDRTEQSSHRTPIAR